jgi:predicted glutamine amidotransferase
MMCRLLAVKAVSPFAITPHLEKFAFISKHSKEYQGHGWGCAYQDMEGAWQIYKNINPIWEDDLSVFPDTRLLVAHARSAFEDRDIVIENNMPFFDGRTVFVFNGELRGVRIKAEGRIGAEKIFNTIRRFDKGDTTEALSKATRIIKKRTQYIRGMNIILINEQGICVFSHFNEDEDYFTMHYRENRAGEEDLIVCSEPYPSEDHWKSIQNNTMRVW